MATSSIPSSSRKIAAVVSRFNEAITSALLNSFKNHLVKQGWKEEEIDVVYVPGAFETPIVAQNLARKGIYQGIVALGCVIKGETAHFEYISETVAHGLMRVSLDEALPVLFGILTTYTEEQAIARTLPSNDKGKELAEALLDTLKALAL